MRALSSIVIPDIWERGYGQPMYRRALFVLAAASPEMSIESLEKLSIGSRDARLLKVHELTFGPELIGTTRCMCCNGSIEIKVTTFELFEGTDNQDQKKEIFRMQAGDYKITFRLPCTKDLEETDKSSTGKTMRSYLFNRCIASAVRGETVIDPKVLPVSVTNSVIAEIARRDALSDMHFSSVCRNCGNKWIAPFDIVSFLWSEIEARAIRLMQEVNQLASVYGWNEREILSLSPLRRNMYLNIVSL